MGSVSDGKMFLTKSESRYIYFDNAKKVLTSEEPGKEM